MLNGNGRLARPFSDLRTAKAPQSPAFPFPALRVYRASMLTDRAFFGLALSLAGLIIVLSAVWPQGDGGRSPGFFGHTVVVPSYVKAQLRRQAIRARERAPLRPALSAPEAPKP